MGNRVILIFISAVFAAAPALAFSGTVVDEQGRAIEGATACILADGKPLICDETDASGYYTLLDTRLTTLRIRKTGYVPAMLAPVTQEAPIVLRRAAALRVRVVDAATGAPVGGGRVVVSYPSGRVLDDFPFNASGVHIATIEPGPVRIRADVRGFRGDAVDVALEAGHEAAVVLEVRKED